MSLKLISKELIEVEPGLAAQWLNFDTYGGQRTVKSEHINFLCDQIKRGLFGTGLIGVARKAGEKEDLLMNGNHQLPAISRSGKTVTCVLERWEYDKINHLSKIYNRYDTHLTRTLTYLTRASHFALSPSWNEKISKLVVSAMTYVHYGEKYVHPVIKSELLEKNMDFGELLSQIFGHRITPSNRHVARRPVVAAIYLTWKANINKDNSSWDTKLFWAKVCDGGQLKNTAPEFTLREYLIRVGLPGSYVKHIAKPREILVKCIHAWNARRKNKSTNLAYSPNRPIPEPV